MTLFVRLHNFFALIILGASVVCAQQRDAEIKFRLAQSYERGGSYETAAKLYEELYAKDSINYNLVDALRRMYVQLKRYDNAVALLQARLRKFPNDIVGLSQLGTVYLRVSNEQKAFDAWDKAVALDPKNESTYRIVCDAMVENRVFDHAIALYQRGRTALNNPSVFTMDLAYLYSILLNYSEATREYLHLLKDTPQQLEYVQSRLASYTGRADGLSAATLVVEQAVQSELDNTTFLQVLSWLYMEGKRYESAYAVYKRLDEKTKAGGREVYNFAERALKEKAYDVASNAFNEVVTAYPSFKLLPQAKFGYARTLEEASTGQDTLKLFGTVSPFSPKGKPVSEAQPTFTGAIAAYNRIVAEYPNTEIAARSLVRIAAVTFEQFFNLNEARSALETIERQYTSYIPVLLEAKLLLGDVFLAAGDLDKAETAFKSLGAFRFVVTSFQEQGAFRLAELNYFRGNFKEALSQLGELTKNATSDITNDALSLQILIQENQEPSEAALREYAKAALLERQRKLSEAMTLFDTIAKTYKESSIIDGTLMEMGDILTHMNRFADAVAVYERLVTEFPESIMLDRTLMKIGEVRRLGLHDKTKAVESYTTLLEKYPNSIFVGEARKRIRDLRGDTP